MTFFDYTDNIPFSSNDPSTDQPDLLVNTNSVEGIWLVDHHGFQDNLGGYHTNIHQDALLVDPAAIPGPPAINQIYVKSVTPNSTVTAADTQLFTRTALGDISQMTGFLINKLAAVVGPPSYPDLFQGYQWIGGILLQWGYVVGTHGSDNHFNDSEGGSITFKDRVPGAIPFPNNCFFVMPASAFFRTATPSGEITFSIDQATMTKLGFNWRVNTGSNKYTLFYWIAIGN